MFTFLAIISNNFWCTDQQLILSLWKKQWNKKPQHILSQVTWLHTFNIKTKPKQAHFFAEYWKDYLSLSIKSVLSAPFTMSNLRIWWSFSSASSSSCFAFSVGFVTSFFTMRDGWYCPFQSPSNRSRQSYKYKSVLYYTACSFLKSILKQCIKSSLQRLKNYTYDQPFILQHIICSFLCSIYIIRFTNQ